MPRSNKKKKKAQTPAKGENITTKEPSTTLEDGEPFSGIHPDELEFGVLMHQSIAVPTCMDHYEDIYGILPLPCNNLWPDLNPSYYMTPILPDLPFTVVNNNSITRTMTTSELFPYTLTVPNLTPIPTYRTSKLLEPGSIYSISKLSIKLRETKVSISFILTPIYHELSSYVPLCSYAIVTVPTTLRPNSILDDITIRNENRFLYLAKYHGPGPNSTIDGYAKDFIQKFYHNDVHKSIQQTAGISKQFAKANEVRFTSDSLKKFAYVMQGVERIMLEMLSKTGGNTGLELLRLQEMNMERATSHLKLLDDILPETTIVEDFTKGNIVLGLTLIINLGRQKDKSNKKAQPNNIFVYRIKLTRNVHYSKKQRCAETKHCNEHACMGYFRTEPMLNELYNTWIDNCDEPGNDRKSKVYRCICNWKFTEWLNFKFHTHLCQNEPNFVYQIFVKLNTCTCNICGRIMLIKNDFMCSRSLLNLEITSEDGEVIYIFEGLKVGCHQYYENSNVL